MKITVNTKELTNKLNLLSSVIANNATLPILECFKFDVENNVLKMTASDMQNTITTTLNVESSENGNIAIPHRILLDTLKALPNGSIKIIVNDLNITLQTEKGKYKLNGENASDFPTIEEIESKEIILNSQVLQDGIKSTLFAISNDELRPAMTGLFFQFKNDKLNLVSTDASRLSLYTLESESLENDFIVPKKALNVLKSSLFDNDVFISANNTNVCFKYGDNILTSRLIDAKYPQYEAIIPDNDKVVKVDRLNLLNALKRTSLFSNKTTFTSVFSFSENLITLHSQDLDFNNEATETVNCICNDLNDLKIGFNSRFFIELLQNIDTSDVDILVSNDKTAALIKPNDKVTILQMPMSIV